MKENAIILFTRTPTPGKAKTRLQPFLTGEECSELQKAFIQDIYSMLRDIDAEIAVCHTNDGSISEISILAPDADLYFEQNGESLGDRMHNAFCHLFSIGYRRCILIGSDVPLLHKQVINEAFLLLENHDIVIGPTEDGGYYLIGMMEPCKEVFSLQEYGVSTVLEKTMAAAASLSKKTAIGPAAMDIDTPEDLLRLAEILKDAPPDKCIETRATIEKFSILNSQFSICSAKQAISVIIPIYNESSNIDKLLELKASLEHNCEILIVDGGSTDGTIERLEENGFSVKHSPKKGRANQMNYGASLASGDVLWFVHADSKLPPNALALMQEVLERDYKIGCFHLRFDSKNLLMYINALFSNMRVRFRNIAFGDQGIFIRKDLFNQIGGFAPIPLMEDYRLSLDITKKGYKIGMAKGKITTSERRYTQGGRWKTIRLMWSLQRKFRRGDDIEEIAGMYGS